MAQRTQLAGRGHLACGILEGHICEEYHLLTCEGGGWFDLISDCSI